MVRRARQIGSELPRLGLCCMFQAEPIRFRTTTAAAAGRLTRGERLARLSALCLANGQALLESLAYCAAHGIGCFRINSQILPIRTHPQLGYQIDELPDAAEIRKRFERCGEYARDNALRTCFHPDQFVVLNSPREDVVAKSIEELDYQAEVAEWVGADVINIHGGGAYDDKRAALDRFAACLTRLPQRVRRRLTVENDDKIFTPADLLPHCRRERLPLVLDAHHHRCLPDGLSLEEATEQALATWDREPLFHISSPLAGWSGPQPRRHHDYIDVADFPDVWRRGAITVEVEAKAKELAVKRLREQLTHGGSERPKRPKRPKRPEQSERPVEAKSWYVYILRCSDGSFYTGATNDLERRLEQHNAGTAARYTRGRTPVARVYAERLANRGEALRREAAIKTLSRDEKRRLIAATPAP